MNAKDLYTQCLDNEYSIAQIVSELHRDLVEQEELAEALLHEKFTA